MSDPVLRHVLDASDHPVTLGQWRAVMVAGELRLGHFETGRYPDRPPVFTVTVYREPIPQVHRLSKTGALKLLDSMTDQESWTAVSEESLEAALDAVRWAAGGLTADGEG